jgi:hypothetical protein
MMPLTPNVTVPPPANAARRLSSVALLTTPAAQTDGMQLEATRRITKNDMRAVVFIRQAVFVSENHRTPPRSYNYYFCPFKAGLVAKANVNFLNSAGAS